MSRDELTGELTGEHHRREREQALTAVFRVFAARWPRFFSGSRAIDLLPIWLPAVAGIDTAHLEPAAIAYAAQADGPAPAPVEFTRWTRAYVRRVTGEDRHAAPAQPRDVGTSRLHGARPFWFAQPGPDRGPWRLDAERALALSTAEGCYGISDPDMDRLWKRTLAGGWLAPEEVPAWAVPTGWHASHGLALTGPTARSA